MIAICELRAGRQIGDGRKYGGIAGSNQEYLIATLEDGRVKTSICALF